MFKERGVWCDLVPVPKRISPDCGMAIAYRPEDAEEVGKVLSDPRIAGLRAGRA